MPDADFSLLDVYDGVIAAAADLQDEFSDAADQAAALAATLRSAVHEVAVPTLSVTAPAVLVTAGGPTTLTATTGGGTGTRTVRWDLDLDGVFDDAVGALVTFTPTLAADQLVGARVTDSRGMIATSYVRIVSTPVSQPAVVTAQSPAGARVTITGGTSQTFTVAASDPENATVGFQWFLDDTPVATGAGYTYTSAVGERSIHAVSVQVSDGDPMHRHTEGRWALTTLP